MAPFKHVLPVEIRSDLDIVCSQSYDIEVTMVELLAEISQGATLVQAILIFVPWPTTLPQTEDFSDFETLGLLFASLSAVWIYLSCYSLKVWECSTNG